MESIKPISDEVLAEIERHALLPFGSAVVKWDDSAILTLGELASITKRLRQAEKDAERYRWLRNKGFSFVNDEAGQGISICLWGDFALDTIEGLAYHMDRAIDAAMQATRHD